MTRQDPTAPVRRFARIGPLLVLAIVLVWLIIRPSAKPEGPKEAAAVPVGGPIRAESGVEAELKGLARVELEPTLGLDAAPAGAAQVPDAASGPRVVLEQDGVTPVSGLTLVFVGVEELQAASGAAEAAALAEDAAQADDTEVAEQGDSVAQKPWEAEWVQEALRRALRGEPLPLKLEGLAFVGSTDGEGRVWLPEQAFLGFDRGYLVGASSSAFLSQRLVPIIEGQLPATDLLARSLAAVHVDVRFPPGWQPYPVVGVSAFGNRQPDMTWTCRGKRVESIEYLYDGLFPEDYEEGVFGRTTRQLFAFVDGQATGSSAAAVAGDLPTASAAVTIAGFEPATVDIPLVATGRPIEASIDLVPLGLPLGELLIRLTLPAGLPPLGFTGSMFHLTLRETVPTDAKSSNNFCFLRNGCLRLAGIPPGIYRTLMRPLAGSNAREVELEPVEIRSGVQTEIRAPNDCFAWLVIDATAIHYQRSAQPVEVKLHGRLPGRDWNRPRAWYSREFANETSFAAPLVIPTSPGLEWQALIDPPRFFDPIRRVFPAASGGSEILPIELGIIPGGQVCTLKLAEMP